MTKSSREPALKAKEEQNTSDNKIFKPPPTSTTPWSKLKDPRIVRVSRALGGKDRHSKVCTVKGLRDRRVRLSVPTAIQLYGLQDRLGLNQPSKVVDWLLDVTKHEINELPPLQFPPFNHTIPHLQIGGLSFNKNVMNLSTRSEHEKPSAPQGHNTNFLSNSLCTKSDHPHLQGPISNVGTQDAVLQWDPSCLSLSKSGSNESEVHSFNLLSLPSTHSYFPAYVGIGGGDFDPKQVVNYQMLGSSSQMLLPYSNSHITPSYVTSQPIRPLHLSMTTNVFPHQSEQNKED